jgi:phospholipase/carboxylesterase
MLTRRQFALALAGSCIAGCTKKQEPPPSPSQEATTKPTWPRTTTHAGVEMLELYPSDADEKAPLIVAIHGRGDRPQHWVEGWRSFPARAEIVMPRAFTPWGDGYSWFKLDESMSDEAISAEVGAAEAKLWPGLLELAAGRKMVVTGFSQGGILSFVLAARHADVVTHAFPISGACPKGLLPKENAAPITAFHGTVDNVIPIQWDRAGVEALKSSGHQVELREYEGIAHSISPQMRQDWRAELVKAISTAPP